MNLCSILGHKKTSEQYSKRIGDGGEGAEGLYMEMMRFKCSRCDVVFNERPKDFRDT